VHPGNNGTVLVTGSYATESSPLIHGRSLPAYTDTYGMFAVMLNAAGGSQWVQDGPLNGLGYGTGIFEGYPMRNGDFVLAGVCNTGYFKLGNAEIIFPGTVRAVKSTPWGSYPVVDSTQINDDGSYLFTELYPGNYVVQARTDLQDYPEAIPTYYGNSEQWGSALSIDVTPDIKANILNITLSEVPKLTSGDGSGELEGSVFNEDGTFLKGTMAQPSKKSGVILLGKARKSTQAGEVVAYVETDETGMYYFNYVPDGDYILVVEVTGLGMISSHEVTIAGNQIVSGLNYTVSNEGIYAGWPTQVSLPVHESLSIWPNPGEGMIMMDLPASGSYLVKVYATDGRLVQSEEFLSAGGVYTLDITAEQKGMYFLSIEGPETSSTVKYVKK
jgi:co-chaperonin GroES (HSP10)